MARGVGSIVFDQINMQIIAGSTRRDDTSRLSFGAGGNRELLPTLASVPITRRYYYFALAVNRALKPGSRSAMAESYRLSLWLIVNRIVCLL